jgi:DNA/RNA-binding domain of Phe-tRNA-synthetase-like protein
MQLSIASVADTFPDFRVAAVVASDLAITAERPPALAEHIARVEEECRTRWAGRELSEIPGVAAWRRAYRAFGIKKTSYRSSVERLVKNVLAGRSLPQINSFVDSYNAISLAHVLPLGADDLDKVAGDVAFRFSQPGDTFVDMAAEGGEDPNDPPKEGEVVYADAEKVLCRRWNWRQDARSIITPQTRRAIVTVQSNGEGDVASAALELADLIARFSGGHVTIDFASREKPVIGLAQ